MSGRLEGQTVVMTGGGRGFGEHMALAVADEGAHTVVADLDGDNAGRVAGEIAARGGSALALDTDVGDEGQAADMVAAAIDRFGRIDVLVNNAGVAGAADPFPELTLDSWNETYRVNVTGCFLCCRAVLPHMIERGSGHIVHISSGLCRPGVRNIRGLMYLSTKFAVEGLSWGLAVHMEPHGIRVNTIRPNLSATALYDGYDRSFLKGVELWKPTLTVAPLLHLLCESDATGEFIDAAEWHRARGTAAELTYVDA